VYSVVSQSSKQYGALEGEVTMGTLHRSVALGVLPFLALAPGVAAAQEAGGGRDREEMEGAVVLDDFDEPVGARWIGGIQVAQAADGEDVGHWWAALNGDQITLRQVPLDWTPFKVLEFWMWSAIANGQNVMLLVNSPNGETDGPDYFHTRLIVDWEGWKHFVLPLEALSASREPDWTGIEGLSFATIGWAIEALQDTDLYLDAIRLLPRMPRAAERPPDLVSDFEDQDLMLWSGLARDTEHATEGESGGRWERLHVNGHVYLRREMDWSPYQYLEFDCYSEAPTGDRFILAFWSMDAPAVRPHYWAYIFAVNWTGQKHFKIPFRRLYQMRSPIGWDRITEVHMYSNGWGMAPCSPDTVLVFDNMRLTEAEPRDVPPGLIEDFEEGPWAWWWMDEGWRSASGRPITADWTGFTTLKMAVYTQNLDGEVLKVRAGGWEATVPLDGQGWREVSLPLADVHGEVSRLNFRVQGLRGDDTGGANRDMHPAAVLYFDNIRLE
jgi:hypothetical protein